MIGEFEPPLLTWMRERETARMNAGLRRRLSPRPAHQDILDLASNDYLGLARDPRVTAAAAEAALTWGAGATGSRLVTGSTELHAELETALAAHVGTGSSLVFSSGYLANLGAVTALAGKGTLVVSDSLNHASLIDAIRLTGARVVIAGHRDPEAVEDALKYRPEARALVVTDAVFSVDGDLAPLRDLHQVAREYGAAMIVDEAHSLGVVGDRGEGATAAAGLAGEPDVIQVLTLTKSLGSQGGAVAGHPDVIAHLIDTARSFIFDTGLAPACVGSSLAALNILIAEPTLAGRVRARAKDLRDAALAAGWKATDPDGAVASVLVGEPDAAVAAAAVCAEAGVRVGCFRPPSIPDSISRLRMTARANLTDAEVRLAGSVLAVAASAMSESGS